MISENYVDGLELRIKELTAELTEYKEIARQHTELTSKGIYYTLKELEESKKQWILAELCNPSELTERWINTIKANTAKSAILEALLIHGANCYAKVEFVKFADEYSNKILRGVGQ